MGKMTFAALLTLVVALLAFFPASVVIGGPGGGWPLHDAIHPMVGLLLGPILGPVVSIFGTLFGGILAPQNNLGTFGFLLSGMSAFTVGMTMREKWYIPFFMTLAAHLLYLYLALTTGVTFFLWLTNVFTVDVALILIAIPKIRNWAIATINQNSVEHTFKLFAAYFVVFFFGSTAGMQALWVFGYAADPWPVELWGPLSVIIFLERIVFTTIGILIAIPFITSLRRRGLKLN